jgi:hypothetical protein
MLPAVSLASGAVPPVDTTSVERAALGVDGRGAHGREIENGSDAGFEAP